MTFTEEFIAEEGQTLIGGSEYPQAFGITFTPKVQAIALGVLGVIVGVYVFANLVMPAYSSYQAKKTEEADLQSQVETQRKGEFKKKIQAAEVELSEKQGLKKQVITFFGDEKSLKTLLLDVNQFLQSRNVELLSFSPEADTVIINDGSLGPAVNNKLKRQTINIELKGGFEQTQSILRDLERLQPLILIKNLNTQVTEDQSPVLVVTSKDKSQPQVISKEEKKVRTTFQIQVILPLTAEEAAQFAPAPTPEGQQPPPSK